MTMISFRVKIIDEMNQTGCDHQKGNSIMRKNTVIIMLAYLLVLLLGVLLGIGIGAML